MSLAVVKVSFERTSYSTVEGSSVLAVLVTDRCFEGEFEVDLVPTLISAEGMICVCMYVCMYICVGGCKCMEVFVLWVYVHYCLTCMLYCGRLTEKCTDIHVYYSSVVM